MTPEQEILEDALSAAMQRAASFRAELINHSRSLPLDGGRDWSDPSDELRTEMAAFVKRYEMTQDLVSRRLFRTVLAVKGTKLRSNALVHVVVGVAALGIVTDLPRWKEITKLRNSFAHDYAMTFAEVVPLINQAWHYAPDLIDMIERVDRFVAAERLLATGEQ